MDEQRIRDLMEHDCRSRLAETCGTRDESPSSNLGRGKERQSEQTSCVDDRGPRLMSSPNKRHREQVPNLMTQRRSEWDMTWCFEHGVP